MFISHFDITLHASKNESSKCLRGAIYFNQTVTSHPQSIKVSRECSDLVHSFRLAVFLLFSFDFFFVPQATDLFSTV